ncbi:MAG: hypothetical protein ACOZBZ_02790 [Patescibacteria group bacterium]
MTERIFKILPWIGGALMIFNLLLLDFVLVSRQKREPKITETAKTTFETPMPTPAEICTPQCKTYIEEEVSKAVSGLPTPSTVKEKIVQSTPTPSGATGAKVVYIPIISSASTVKMDWTDIASSDFYFDLSDYPGAKTVRWEASLKSLHGSGKIYARLYDVTNKRAIDYSDLETISDSFTLVRSSDLTIWRGNNLYRVQMKSINGTEAFLEQAKLRVIFE